MQPVDNILLKSNILISEISILIVLPVALWIVYCVQMYHIFLANARYNIYICPIINYDVYTFTNKCSKLWTFRYQEIELH